MQLIPWSCSPSIEEERDGYDRWGWADELTAAELGDRDLSPSAKLTVFTVEGRLALSRPSIHFAAEEIAFMVISEHLV